MLSELQPRLFTPEQAGKMVAPDATTTKQVLAVAARAFHKKAEVLDRRMPSKNGVVVVTTLKGLAAMSEFEGMATDRLDGWRMAYNAERLDNIAYRQTGASIQYVKIPAHLR
jgi:hypothetical protein